MMMRTVMMMIIITFLFLIILEGTVWSTVQGSWFNNHDDDQKQPLNLIKETIGFRFTLWTELAEAMNVNSAERFQSHYKSTKYVCWQNRDCVGNCRWKLCLARLSRVYNHVDDIDLFTGGERNALQSHTFWPLSTLWQSHKNNFPIFDWHFQAWQKDQLLGE